MNDQVTPPTTPPPIAAPRPRSSWAWPFASVAIVMIFALTALLLSLVVLGKAVVDMPVNVADRIAQGFRPQINETTLIRHALTELNTRAKLVALTPTFDVQLSRSAETKMLWGMLDLGTTTVRMRASGNKVQYIVPLDQLREADFKFDTASRTLSLTLPPPELDHDIVEVQSDPAKIEIETENGWAKLDRYSGGPMRDDVKREFRSAVLRIGNSEWFQTQARVHAKDELERILAGSVKAIGDNIRVSVQFK